MFSSFCPIALSYFEVLEMFFYSLFVNITSGRGRSGVILEFTWFVIWCFVVDCKNPLFCEKFILVDIRLDDLIFGISGIGMCLTVHIAVTARRNQITR